MRQLFQAPDPDQVLSDRVLGDDAIERVLAFARRHLGMDLAWLSHVSDGRQVIEALDGAAPAFGVAVGSSPIYQLGARVVAGELPPVLNDLQGDVRTANLEVTREMGIGAYAGVPLRLPDGRLYGMLSCFSWQPDPSLQDRDAQFLSLVAEVLAPSVAERDERHRRHAEIEVRVVDLLSAGGPRMVYQPVRSLADQRIIAYEALARFPAGHGGPDQWFADAADVGLGIDLERCAAAAGARALDVLPRDQAVAINLSAQAVLEGAVQDVLTDRPSERVIVEITEHTAVDDYPALRAAISQLRDAGARVACDDAGSGCAGFQHLVELTPDIIKIDYQLIHGIDTDAARAAMTSALVGFAGAINATVLAEGVETAAELSTVRRLGADLAQGYHLGRPAPLGEVTPTVVAV